MKKLTLLSLFFFLPIFIIYGQTAEELYQKGMKELESGDVKKAITIFQSLVESDKKDLRAWIALGRSYDELEPGSREAERALNHALKRNRRNGKAYYYLGLVWSHRDNRHKEAMEQLKLAVHFSPQLTDAWELLGFLHEQNANEKPVVMMFSDALLANPKHLYFYDNLLRTAFTYQYENKAIKTLNKYLKITENPGRVTVDLADTHRRKGDVKKADEIFTALTVSETPWPECRGNLIRARICFDLGRDDAGIEFYWRSVNAIKDSVTRQLFFENICFIMRDEEYDIHQQTPIDSLPLFYRRLWRSRDPNLKTELNERIPEHYRRLTRAETDWRRSPIGYQHSILLHRREGPFRDINLVGDEFIDAAFFPKALPRDRTIDDLGVVYIRHGEPAREIKPNFSNAGYNVTWVYEESTERPGMIFHFQRIGEHTGWMLEAIPGNTENLEMVHTRYSELQYRLDEEGRLSPSLRGFATETRDINLNFLKTGMTTETTNYKTEEQPIDLPFQYLFFKGEKTNEVELYYLIHGGAVDLDTTRGCVDLDGFMCIHNHLWDKVSRNDRHIDKALDLTQEQWAVSGFVMRESFPLPPGQYYSELQVIDNIGHKRAIHKSRLISPDYFQDRLQLSDVLLTREIDESKSSPFERNGIPLDPHMFYAFPGESYIGVYFEVYNLLLDDAGKSRYQVSFTLQHTDLDKPTSGTVFAFVKNLFMDKRQVTSQFDSEGRTPDDYIYMNLLFPERESGAYDLIIRVKDMASGQVAVRRVGVTFR